ncbi:DUF3772 domain-containing protein [Xanthomonas chitinilytica]|uniref:DUF3772 domain-containing protein n=1 Tax=Xanthomonas chitinilytica TaxID=2989819 RepID=UPI003CCCD08E
MVRACRCPPLSRYRPTPDRLRPLRWLLFCLCLCLVLPLAAQTVDAPTPQAQIDKAASALEAVRQSLDSADTPDTLKTLAERALAVQRDADAAARTLAPVRDQLDAQLAQLGEVAEGTVEDADISRQRSKIGRDRSDVDSAIKRGNLLALEAQQLAESIERMRVSQFGAQLSRRVASPLSPALWRQFLRDQPDDWKRLRALYRQGRDGLRQAVAEHGYAAPLAGVAVALVLALPLRLWLRRLGRRQAAKASAPDSRLRRSGLAVWLLLVGTLAPGLAALALVEALHFIEAIPPRLEQVASQLVTATFIAAFIASLSSCLLMPRQPSWRLLPIDDTAAIRLRKYIWATAALSWISMMLLAVNRAARTSEVLTVAVDGVVALANMALIIAILVALSRLRRRRAQEAEAARQAGARMRGASGNGWMVIASVLGHVAVAAALLAVLVGYLNFAMFVTRQLVWGVVVVAALALLLKFVDDLSGWLFGADSSLGRAANLATGLSPARVEQAGVLLSALLRLGLLVLGIGALLAPLGSAGSVFGWFDTAARGIRLGGFELTPGAVVRALLLLAIGLAVVQAVQRWLSETYLPRTELDTGARNSISTVARYVGIIVVVMASLAALGIGLEKLALVVSALSVGIGFGLQAITQNFVSGLILLAERPVKIGDWIKIGDQEGDIRRISVRSTEIQVGDKSTLIVPNSELITKTIRNMTMANPQGRIQIQFSVPLNTDVARLRQLLLQAYGEHEGVLDDPAPSVFIDSIAGGQVAINSFAYVSSPRNVYGTRSELLFAILQRLSAAGIALVTPTDIHIVRDPAAAVETETKD